MTLFITKNGQRLGPYSLDEAKTLKANGQVQDNDLAWYEGLAEWIPLSQVPGFFSTPPVPEPTLSIAEGGSVLVWRLLTAGMIFGISFVILFVVISLLILIVGGGIAGAEASASQPAEGFQQGYEIGARAGLEFREKYGGLVAGISVLASLGSSALIAWLTAFSNLFPWCRRK